MSEFNNVTAVKNANVYFDGGVTSRTIKFKNGEIKTLGLMQPGEYEFNTDKKEIMEIQLGEVDVLLPDQTEWQRFVAGDTFEVKANALFKITALSLTDYCCSFVD
jgi:uncharacterized protein YaiE (UPF0345 family)